MHVFEADGGTLTSRTTLINLSEVKSVSVLHAAMLPACILLPIKMVLHAVACNTADNLCCW